MDPRVGTAAAEGEEAGMKGAREGLRWPPRFTARELGMSERELRRAARVDLERRVHNAHLLRLGLTSESYIAAGREATREWDRRPVIRWLPERLGQFLLERFGRRWFGRRIEAIALREKP